MTDYASDAIAVTNGAIVPRGTPTDEQFEAIRSFGIHNDDLQPSDVFVYDQVASGDGVDFYATRQAESSLKQYVTDLKHGQSVLGSHDTGTYSVGNSWDGELRDADPLASYYESTFYARWARPDYATQKVVIGSYYIPRGLELNGQPTDSLIKSLQAGNIRKASISFIPDRYTCSLDGEDMLAGYGSPLPAGIFSDDPDACMHFPGVEYKGELAYAWMHDSTMVETSLVYKNASPSALLVRKAEELAKRGALDKRQVVRLEERLGRSLPAFERKLYGAVEPPEDQMKDKQDPVGTSRATDEDPPEGEEQAMEEDEDAGDDAEATQSEAVEAREREIREALGVADLDAATLAALRAATELGEQMYSTIVEEAVSARVRSVGARGFTQAEAEVYRSSLNAMRNPAYVMKEIDLYSGDNPFKAGRQVRPGELPAEGQPSVIQPAYQPMAAGRLVGVLNNGGVAVKEK